MGPDPNLKAEDGELMVSSPIVRSVTESVVTQDRGSIAPARSITQTIESTSPFSISIKIEVHCEPKDLDSLGVKLRKVVDDFSRQQADDSIED